VKRKKRESAEREWEMRTMTPEIWNVIRRFYSDPGIDRWLQSGKRIDPYFVDWASLLTGPITMLHWQMPKGTGSPAIRWKHRLAIFGELYGNYILNFP
jgi:hypothetical protein